MSLVFIQPRIDQSNAVDVIHWSCVGSTTSLPGPTVLLGNKVVLNMLHHEAELCHVDYKQNDDTSECKWLLTACVPKPMESESVVKIRKANHL